MIPGGFLESITSMTGVANLTTPTPFIPIDDHRLTTVRTATGWGMSTHAGDLVRLIRQHGSQIWQGSPSAPLDRSGSDVRRPWM